MADQTGAPPPPGGPPPRGPQPATGTTRRVGRYEVLREIGRGGMAVVYLARQTDLDRYVALKELSSFHAGSKEFAERFMRESRVAGSLSHPNLVTVHDYFEHEGTPYIAMEYVPRGSLRPHVGRLSVAQVAGVLEGMLAGLAHAEPVGIVHRDLKPENIMVTGDGRVKIADFGIAKATQAAGTAAFMTATGTTVGTPAYMAPEQAMAQSIGPWTDLYSVGVMTYEMVIGRVPFHDTEAPMAILLRHVNETIAPAAQVRPGIDQGLSDWIDSLLVKDPERRVRSAVAAWDNLEEIILGLLGPRWRREARLPTGTTAMNTPPPLTPAPFESRRVQTPDPTPAPPAQSGFVTYDPGVVGGERPPRAVAPPTPPTPARAQTSSPAPAVEPAGESAIDELPGPPSSEASVVPPPDAGSRTDPVPGAEPPPPVPTAPDSGFVTFGKVAEAAAPDTAGELREPPARDAPDAPAPGGEAPAESAHETGFVTYGRTPDSPSPPPAQSPAAPPGELPAAGDQMTMPPTPVRRAATTPPAESPPAREAAPPVVAPPPAEASPPPAVEASAPPEAPPATPDRGADASRSAAPAPTAPRSSDRPARDTGEPAVAGAPAAAGAAAADAPAATPSPLRRRAVASAAATAPAPAREAPSDRVASRRRAVAAVALAAALVAAAVGYLVAPSKSGSGSTLAASGSVSSPAFQLAIPAGWHREPTAAVPATLNLTNPVALASGRSGGGTLVVGTATPADRTLLPAGLIHALQSSPAGTAVSLGGVQYYRYRDLVPRGSSTPETAYAAQSSTGGLVAVCLTPQAGDTAAVAGCESALRTLRLTSGHALALGPSATYAAAMQRILAQVNQAIATQGSRLSAARTAAAQAAAAAALQGAYAQARATVATLTPAPVEAGPNAAIAAALGRVAATYGSLATAARRHDQAAYSRASTAVTTAVAGLSAALSQLKALGYTLG